MAVVFHVVRLKIQFRRSIMEVLVEAYSEKVSENLICECGCYDHCSCDTDSCLCDGYSR